MLDRLIDMRATDVSLIIMPKTMPTMRMCIVPVRIIAFALNRASAMNIEITDSIDTRFVTERTMIFAIADELSLDSLVVIVKTLLIAIRC